MAPGKGRVMREGRRGRVIVRVLVFAVVGVVLSFASALPVLWVNEFDDARFLAGTPGSSPYLQVTQKRLGVQLFFAQYLEDMDGARTRNKTLDSWWIRSSGVPDGYLQVGLELAGGFPLPVLTGGEIAAYGLRSNEWGLFDLDRTISLKWTQDGVARRYAWRGTFWPTRPIWRGLIGNTVFYGVIAWGMVALMAWMRRASRRRRGLCEWCGYSLRGLEDAERCPECGGERKATRHQAIGASS